MNSNRGYCSPSSSFNREQRRTEHGGHGSPSGNTGDDGEKQRMAEQGEDGDVERLAAELGFGGGAAGQRRGGAAQRRSYELSFSVASTRRLRRWRRRRRRRMKASSAAMGWARRSDRRSRCSVVLQQLTKEREKKMKIGDGWWSSAGHEWIMKKNEDWSCLYRHEEETWSDGRKTRISAIDRLKWKMISGRLMIN